jgi:nitrate/nitrite transporter NarK
MRGVVLCAVATLAALAASAGGASADRGGSKHVTVLHPVAPATAPAGVSYTLRDAGAFSVRDQGAHEFVNLASAVAFVRNGTQVRVFVIADNAPSGAASEALTVYGT